MGFSFVELSEHFYYENLAYCSSGVLICERNMSIVRRTIEAFPKGRTTEQLWMLLGSAFDHDKKIAVLAELDALSEARRIVKGRDGKIESVGHGLHVVGAALLLYRDSRVIPIIDDP